MVTKPLSTDDKALDFFKTDPRELERHKDPEQVRLRGENMLARGQLQDVAATEDGRMIFGHGRWLAAKAVGIKTLRVRIYPSSLTDTEFRLIRAAENLQRNELTGYQKFLLCSELMCGNPTWAQKDLAAALNLDPAQVTRLLSPCRCAPAWQEALKAGKVSISDCYAASKLSSPEEQNSLLALKLSGASRDALERAVKKSKNEKHKENGKTEDKVSRIKFVVPSSGVNVLVSGSRITLEASITALKEAVKELERARDLGLTAKTFGQATKDMRDKKRNESEKKGGGDGQSAAAT